MNKVLVTGIEPFDGDAVNPSWQVAQALAGEQIAGAEIAVLELPCVLGQANLQLIAAIEALQPLAVICLGLAGGRAEISLERVAINLIDARIPDNAGKQPIDVAGSRRRAGGLFQYAARQGRGAAAAPAGDPGGGVLYGRHL